MPQRWQWDETKEQVLHDVFVGRFSHAAIAEKHSISPDTLKSWLKHPAFRKRLDSLRANLADALQGVTYADKARRIVALDQMAEDARKAYEERRWLVDVTADGTTKQRYNRAAFDAFRGALDDIADELGHRSNSVAVDEDGGGITIRITQRGGQSSEAGT